MQYRVKSWRIIRGESGPISDRTIQNGELGPFSDRVTAERALVSLCQSGNATGGEIFSLGEEVYGPAAERVFRTIKGLLEQHASMPDSFVKDALSEIEAALDVI
jgi:hypothetical protein